MQVGRITPRCVARSLARAPISVLALLALASAWLLACESSTPPKSDTELQADIVGQMHTLVMKDMTMLLQAAHDLQDAAPVDVADGWDNSPAATAAMSAMRDAWRRARSDWERMEGAVAPLFPDLDASMDARYEDLLDALNGAGDAHPFDDTGATGMHAIERILYAPSPAPVARYESTLVGYWEAAWPATEQEAREMKMGLLQRLVTDSQSLLDQWKNRSIDLNVVFMGLTGLIASQAEKVNLVGAQQEESRYSSTTLADMRSNLQGTRDIYDLFTNWLDTKEFGMTLNHNAMQAFDALDQAYGAVPGDAVPAPPESWVTGQTPSQADLDSPFGQLYTAVVQAADANRPGSAVDAMNHVAWALGLATPPPGQN